MGVVGQVVDAKFDVRPARIKLGDEAQDKVAEAFERRERRQYPYGRAADAGEQFAVNIGRRLFVDPYNVEALSLQSLPALLIGAEFQNARAAGYMANVQGVDGALLTVTVENDLVLEDEMLGNHAGAECL